MKKILLFGMALVLVAALAGCGGGGDDTIFVNGPGFVGIDDTGASTAPLLRVTFTVPPSIFPTTVSILSDPASDGDIEFNPALATFTVTSAPPVFFFGFDSLSANLPEFRGFVTFPLDGVTGQPIVPGTAVIVSAELEVFVDRVNFASTVPTFLDLVQYTFRGLAAADFNSAPISFRTLDFLSSDPGNFVLIDVTPLMQEAQLQAFGDFQVRFLVDSTGVLSATRAPSRETGRTIRSAPRLMDNVIPNRGPSSAGPSAVPAPGTRKR